MKLIDDYIKKSSLYSPFKEIVLYRGVNYPKIMFVGEAPGKEENIQGYPFVGRSGKLLDSWIREFDLQSMIGITNVVPLIPLTPAGGIRAPSLQEIEYFRPFIYHMLRKYIPKLIILLGASACQSLLKTYISEARNQLFDQDGFFFTAHYHPSYYLRRGDSGLKDFGILYENIIRQFFPDLPTFQKEQQKTEKQEIEEIINK